MIRTLKTLITINLMLLAFTSYSQKSKIIGLWEAVNVNVGENNMTPVAKWFELKQDGSFNSGNGWLRNSAGSWEYDAETNTFSAYDSLGIDDPAGSFTVSFDKEHMYWEREEEGMNVKVTLKAIQELPKSPADYLRGIWDLEQINDGEESIADAFDPEDKHYLFFRWDRILIDNTAEGERKTAYWHINGHKAEITILPHQEEANPESWRIEVDKNSLVMQGISESNKEIKRVYKRRRTFP